jgi:hypothetical protein
MHHHRFTADVQNILISSGRFRDGTPHRLISLWLKIRHEIGDKYHTTNGRDERWAICTVLSKENRKTLPALKVISTYYAYRGLSKPLTDLFTGRN